MPLADAAAAHPGGIVHQSDRISVGETGASAP